jgi:hypothetical protein
MHGTVLAWAQSYADGQVVGFAGYTASYGVLEEELCRWHL